MKNPRRFSWRCVSLTAAIFSVIPPLYGSALKVTRLEALGPDAAPFDTLEVQFSHAVQDGTFTVADVTFTGPGGSLVPVAVTRITALRYAVDFGGQTGLASYSLGVGPEILDLANDPMDQDGDGTPGESSEDRFNARLVADNAIIDDATHDGEALLFAIGSATVNGDHDFAHVESQRGASPLFAGAASLAFHSLRADTASSLRIGGGTTVNVTGTVTVTGHSELRLRSKDNSGAVGGQFIGAGVTLNAADAVVDSGSAITADGEGYFNGNGPGYGGNGSAHGGRGDGGDAGFSTQPVYGDGFEPVTLGSGGSIFNASSQGGGAIRLHVEGALTLNGEISADGVGGGQVYGGASGGSIWATAGTLAGAGKFTADGTAASGPTGAGGGGRIAVYYGSDGGFGGFHSSTVAAGGGSAQKGTLIFVDTSVADGAARISQRFDFSSGRTLASLAVDNAALVELEGGTSLTVQGTLSLAGNSTLRVHGKDNTGPVGGQFIGAGGVINAGTLTVGAGSIITADGEGYVNGTGPGFLGGDGGTHGGKGASSFGPSSKPEYGDALQPVELGSGASVFNNTYVAGGGAIRINVSGTFELNGEVSADAFGTGGAQEGAAGGSVWITTGVLSGSGKFTADGAAGGDNRHSGGGGRIAVYYSSGAGFAGFGSSSVSAGGERAEAGTLLFVDTSVPGGGYRVSKRMALGVDGAADFGMLTIDNGAVFEMGGGATLNVTGALNITGNSTLRVHSKDAGAQVGGRWIGRGGTINAGSLTVGAGSLITADGEGYVGSRGPGYGSGFGGTHGGIGSAGSRAFYNGDAFAPVELGSGGNLFNNRFVVGGGAIRLVVSGTFTLDGEVSADASGNSGAYDGAAGGSIWVTAGTLAGSGKFTADGCSGGDPNRPSGGGGRIAVYYQTDGGFGGFLASSASAGVPNGTPPEPAAEPGTMFFARGSALGPEFRVSQRFFVPEEAAMVGGKLTIDDAALFEIGGRGAVIIGGAVSLSDNSEIRFLSLNNSGPIGGEFVGRGSRLCAGSLAIDATSKLNADGLGYNGSSGPGQGIGGASHGGLGGASDATKLYGDANAPVELGTSSWGNYPVGGGGAIEIAVTGLLKNDGLITADSPTAVFNSGLHAYGGSGGSVYIRAGSVSGAGEISADGGSGSAAGALSGAGGRVAVFSTAAPAFPLGNMTVNPGTTGNPAAQAGTRVLQQSDRRFVLLSPKSGFAHGLTTFDFAGLGFDPQTTRATVEVRRGSAVFPVIQNAPVVGRATWDSSVAPDGAAEVRVVFRNQSNQPVGEGAAPLVINNASLWHGGRLPASETWTAGKVHIVEEDVLVLSGATLTIEPGAVVKFLSGKRIVARNGGVVDASASTAQSPVVLTSIADDTAGGDSNFDGALTQGRPGDWFGVPLEGTGQFLTSASTETRFARFIRTGNIATQTWPSRSLNIIRDNVTVESGQTLTVQPGAVVKFEIGRKMIVNGTLDAPGTFAQPIAFTSIRDDAHGGDANRDGNTTVPFPTDWRNIQINGSAAFDHCFIGYGQGESSVDGILRVNGSAQMKNCTVADAVFSGVIVYGTATIENTLVLRTDRAIDTQNGSTMLRNCVIHANRIGLFPHGGALTAVNSLITGNTEAGVQFATSAAVLRYCDVFGNATNFLNHPDPTGSDGNVSVEPRYRDAGRDDFRLKFGSPVIDAADGADAPVSDRGGAPRYDDPRTANTGTPAANGAFADLGVFEFVEAANLASNLDLAVSDVSGPAGALAGDTVTVRWKIRNAGSETVIGPWFDTVAIRTAGGALAPVFAGEFEVGSGVMLGAGQTFEASAQVRVPGGTVGKYEWQVIANSRGTVFEGANTANNTATSAVSFDLDVPELVIGAPPVSASFAALDQPLWFKVRPGTGTQLKVSADLDGPGITELYVSKGLLPSRELFEHKQIQFAAPDVSTTIPNTQPQTYYVLAYPASLSSTPQAFSIRAESTGLGLEGLTLDRIGGTGRVTIGYKGSLLPADGLYQLIGPGGEVFTAIERTPTDGSQLFATFDLNNLPAGSYTARLVAGSQTLELPGAVTVVPEPTGAGDKIAVNIVAPPTVRQGRSTSVTVELKNTSNVDVYAPVLRLTVDGWGPLPREGSGVEFFSKAQQGTVTRIEIVEVPYLPPPQPQRVRKQFVVMPLNPEEPAGILPPGFTARIVLDGIPELGSEDIKLFVEDLAPGVELDHAASKAAYKPEGVPDGAWDLIYSNFITGLGASTDSANTSLARSANYLSSIGQRPRNMAEILGWELRKASDFGAIERRWNLGPMGYGSEPMENRLKVINAPGDGIAEEVRIMRACGRDPRIFRRKLNTTVFEGRPGDNATLTKSGTDAFELRDSHGSRLCYDTPGGDAGEILLTYAEDPRSRRETYGYTNGRLTSVANDIGQTRTYVYDTSGRIISTTDHVGNTTTFGYDAQSEHLLTITAPQGQVTTFEYYLGEGAAREHAVKRIIRPGGAILNFEFDERGRPSKFSRGSGETEPLIFTYNSDSAMTVTDAAGNASTFRRDAFGRFASVKNPGTHEVRYFYDPLGNQVQTAMPDAHASIRTFWDLQHNISAIVDPSGRASFLTYHPVFNTPETYTDRRSQVTRYTYDEAGGKPNLTRIDYPGGTFELFSHDSRSRVRTNTNARGQTTTWDYDSEDLLTRKTYPNGDYDEFFYDPQTRQNTSVVRHVGVSTETTTLEYDAKRLLSKVTYPDGRWISYTHDAIGRRESMTTQDGFITRWGYDGNSRLKHVKRGGTTAVTFGYDETGRLSSRTFANGASTTYEYAPSGKLKTVSHLRPDQTTIAEYSYEYDAIGLCRAVEGPDGRTEYLYDVNGQLEEVLLPGPRTIRYAYDAEGNRTVAGDSGAETEYATNHLNEYTQVGGDVLTYDEDGNLKTRTSSGVTTTYSYDAVNHLVGVSKPGETVAFEYDALGNISALTRNGVRTEFLVDPLAGGDVIAEYGDGGLVAHYLLGHGLNARVDAANEPAYYLFDANGHTTHLLDSGASVVNSYKYLPFGEADGIPDETVPNAFRYGGQLGMLDAGPAVYARARFYSPELGRFVSRDPSYVYGSNPYLYCNNQPVGNSDPHGADGNDSQQWLDAANQVNQAANATGDVVQAILQAEHSAEASKNLVHASESFLAANNTRSAAGALQLQKQGEGYLKAAGSGGERLATAKAMNGALNGAQALIGAGNLLMGDGQKAGLADRLKSTDPNERMSAQADALLFTGTTSLKFLLSEVPFSGEVIDLGVYVVDEGSKKAFNWWFTPADQDPEDVFGHAAYWRFRKAKEFKVVTSFDPNDITGPAGFGPEMWIDESGLMHFKIRFENLPAATAAAYKVAITLPLDPGLDPATFAFDMMEVAHSPVFPPPGLQSYASRTAVPTDPNPVKVIARLDKSTSTVTWLFESFDPLTGGLPEDPLAGFLPPNNADGDGEGFVTFTIRPKRGATEPLVINAKASIVFDTNPPIETNIHFNTIETGRPDAVVLALPPTTPYSVNGFSVQWTGLGSFSGFAHYNIFVSDNGAPFTLWQPQTTATSAFYPGVVGHTYRFFAQGTDNVGQMQAPKSAADTQTTVVAGTPTVVPPVASAYRGSISFADATHQIEGLVDLAVSANKAFKGAVAINGRQVGFKGAFDAQNRASVSLDGIAPGLEMEFYTAAEGQRTFIYGEVDGNGFSAPFNAFASPWTKTNPCPAAGTYTLVLAPETTGSPAAPLDGSGYLTLTIDKVGNANLTGKFADGAAIKFKGKLDAEGYIAFYTAGKKPGSKILSGEISFPDWPAFQLLQGLLDSFVAPSATTLVLQHPTCIAGSSLVGANPPFLLDGDGLITLDGGGLSAPVTASYTFDAQGKFRILGTNPQQITLTLKGKTGVVTGSFLPTGAFKPVRIEGIILQQQTTGAGYFLNDGQSGRLDLTD